MGLSLVCFFFLMIRRPPRSTQSRSSAASDVYKRQLQRLAAVEVVVVLALPEEGLAAGDLLDVVGVGAALSLIHISEPTRLLSISYAVFCLKKKKKLTCNQYAVPMFS